jgi:hypothetical protein
MERQGASPSSAFLGQSMARRAAPMFGTFGSDTKPAGSKEKEESVFGEPRPKKDESDPKPRKSAYTLLTDKKPRKKTRYRSPFAEEEEGVSEEEEDVSEEEVEQSSQRSGVIIKDLEKICQLLGEWAHDSKALSSSLEASGSEWCYLRSIQTYLDIIVNAGDQKKPGGEFLGWGSGRSFFKL